jgi:uncharacterized coiled-coil protein SlyX
MSNLIIPGGNGLSINPAAETAKDTIGDFEVEYLVKPGAGIMIQVNPGNEMSALVACAGMVSQYSIMLSALVREVITQRTAATKAQAELAELVTKLEALSKRVDAHAGAIDELQDAR